MFLCFPQKIFFVFMCFELAKIDLFLYNLAMSKPITPYEMEVEELDENEYGRGVCEDAPCCGCCGQTDYGDW
jgi:hypothetical protein